MAFLADTAFQYLERAQSHGRLAHAYLITGGEECDLKGFAARVIRLGNGTTGMTLEDHQKDGVLIVRPESKSRRIKVEQMRTIEKNLHLGGQGGRLKVGVIIDADRMVPEAVNAFLKTLEEPPDQSLLLLLTRYPEQLLDTVISRCIRVQLHNPGAVIQRSDEEKALLQAVANHFAEGKLTLPRALGLMRKFSALLKAMKDSLTKEYEQAYKEEKKTYGQTTEGDWLKKRETFFDGVAAAQYIENRRKLVDLLLTWFGDVLRLQNGYGGIDLAEYADVTRAVAEKLSRDDLEKRIDAIETLRMQMETNVNEGLALEVAFLVAFG